MLHITNITKYNWYSRFIHERNNLKHMKWKWSKIWPSTVLPFTKNNCQAVLLGACKMIFPFSRWTMETYWFPNLMVGRCWNTYSRWQDQWSLWYPRSHGHIDLALVHIFRWFSVPIICASHCWIVVYTKQQSMLAASLTCHSPGKTLWGYSYLGEHVQSMSHWKINENQLHTIPFSSMTLWQSDAFIPVLKSLTWWHYVHLAKSLRLTWINLDQHGSYIASVPTDQGLMRTSPWRTCWRWSTKAFDRLQAILRSRTTVRRRHCRDS